MNKMIQYTKTKRCLQSTIINYFNPNEHLKNCGQCSNCVKQDENYNMTTEAKQILSCLIRIKIPVTKVLLSKVLHGESDDQIHNESLDTLSTFGLLKNYEASAVQSFIDTLIFNGYIRIHDNYLYCDEAAKAILFKDEQVMTYYKPNQYNEKVKITTIGAVDDTLLKALKTARKELSERLDIPPFTIFSDHTLELLPIRSRFLKKI